MGAQFLSKIFLTLCLFIPLNILIGDEIISKINFVSNTNIDEEELKLIISLKESGQIQPDLVDESIRELYATGMFRNIQVYKEKGEAGITITFFLYGKDTVKKIYFFGNRFISDKRLLRNIPMQEKMFFTEDALKGSIDKIKSLYRDAGFFQLQIKHEVVGTGTGNVEVTFRIQEGKRKLIDEIEFNCESESVKDIFNKKFRYHDFYYDKEKFEDSLQEVADYLIGIGYWNIKISPPELLYDPSVDKLKVRVNINHGMKYQIKFTGNSHFSEAELLRAIDFDNKKLNFTAVVLEEWKKKIMEFYQRDGFAMVSVSTKMIEGKQVTEIHFEIQEGSQMRIKEINFYGNKQFDSKKLKGLMLTKKMGIMSGNIDFLYDWMFDYYPKGILINERLTEDLENIEYFYRENGFLNVAVHLKSIESDADAGGLIINIDVKEGDRFYVAKIEMEGNTLFGDEELLKIVGIKLSEPFNPLSADAGVRALKKYYDEHGYIFSKITSEISFTQDGKGIVIKYIIDEGVKAFVSKIFLSGNDTTKGYVLRRELTFSEGDVLTPGAIFESQRKLYRLGFIDRVTVDIKDVKDDGATDLEIKVKESKFHRFDFKIGYGTAEGVRTSLEFTRKNLGGRGQTIFARADMSYWLTDFNPISDIFVSKENYFNTWVFNVGFIWPWLFRQDMDFRINYINQERRRIYQLKSNDVILAVERDLTRHFHGGLQYQLRFREPLSDYTPDPRFEEKRRLGFLSLILLHDTRNNPFEPYKGHLQTYRIDFASRNLAPAGEYDYLKLFVKADFFTGPAKQIVTAFSIRSGYGYVLGKGEIPIEERFFLGGTTSVRGFEEDSLGPVIFNPDNNENIPAGGDFMLGYNLELRLTLRKGFGFVVFSDGGNVWEDVSKTSLKGVATFKDLRESAGVGLRYMTPIGPLRLDIGFKLDKRRDEALSEWHFFVGNMF